MQLKSGVRLLGLKPEMVVAVIAANDVWKAPGVDLVVTSCIDGTHSRSSAHYTGRAMDFRVHDLPDPQAAVAKLKAALGDDFDVILEGAGTPNGHCHVEHDPKLGY